MNVATLKLEGRIDSAAAARLELGFTARAGALTGKDDKAIIDLQDIDYISSMGIRLLVSTVKQFGQRGVRFVTIRPREKLAYTILKTANMTDYLNMVDDREAADALINRG